METKNTELNSNSELDDFFNEMEGLIKPEDVDLNDPRIAGMLGLL